MDMRSTPSYQPTFAERYPVPLIVALTELGLVVLASLLAHYLRFGSFDMPGRYNTATLVAGITVVACLMFTGVYGSHRGKPFFSQLVRFLTGWLVAAGILLALTFFMKTSDNYSRVWFAYLLALGMGLTFVMRLAMYVFLRQVRAGGRNLKTVLLVDSGGGTFKSDQESALRLQGFKVVRRLPFQEDSGWLEKLVEAVQDERVHEVWLSLRIEQGKALPDIMYALRHSTVGVRMFPDWGDLPLLNHKVSHIAGLYSLDLSCTPMDGPARFIKRTEDILIGGLISLLILPVCVGIAIAVKATSPGPVVFKQYRTGINGKKFKVYKFRSMVVHQENGNGVTQAKKNDARITPIGAFLRRTSLDELPQFFNVLQGRMSLVGPRPHALAHNEYYKDMVESYMQRHKVKPGITGWAQVNGYRGETDTLDKMQKRVEYDLWYIDNWSLWLDLKIIFLTVFKGFINKNAY